MKKGGGGKIGRGHERCFGSIKSINPQQCRVYKDVLCQPPSRYSFLIPLLEYHSEGAGRRGRVLVFLGGDGNYMYIYQRRCTGFM